MVCLPSELSIRYQITSPETYGCGMPLSKPALVLHFQVRDPDKDLGLMMGVTITPGILVFDEEQGNWYLLLESRRVAVIAGRTDVVPDAVFGQFPRKPLTSTAAVTSREIPS